MSSKAPPSAKWYLHAGVLVSAGLMGIVASPVATWWLVGDQSTVPTGADPDYFYRPLPINATVATVFGVAAILVVIVSLTVLAYASAARRLDHRWWAAVLPLLVAGLLVGAGWRALTAGVIGANIGAGLVVMFVGPLAGLLTLWGLAWSLHLAVSNRQPTSRP